ncbi:MAG: PRC-barrel domain-containing protein [Phycisphaerales bacterium]|nr:PRC-barrel domain-containing protein [Phycisphaerales bacterium]
MTQFTHALVAPTLVAAFVSAGMATATAAAADASFVPGSKLVDAKVVSRPTDDHDAGIEDLVVDAREGRIVFAIVDTNGVLGVDGRTVVVPYGALNWDAAHGDFLLSLTADQLRALPEYGKSGLADLDSPSWRSTLRSIVGDWPEFSDEDASRQSTFPDRYTWLFREHDAKRMSGRVTAVESGDGLTTITVGDGSSGERQTVVLAPSAFLKRHGVMPAVQDEVQLEAVAGQMPSGRKVCVARSIDVHDKQADLRTDQGDAMWSTAADGRAPVHYVLVSDMDDGSLYGQGEAFGDVDEAVFEPTSGRAAFAIVSVGGVLGVNDILYPVPCKAFRPAQDHNLMSDLPVSKLKLAPKLSKEGIADLNQHDFATTVYEFYNVDAPSFDRPRGWSSGAKAHD